MLFNILFCNILFIPLIYSSNTTVTKPVLANNTQLETRVEKVNVTKTPMLTEGGYLSPDTSIISLHPSLPLDNDMDKNKKNTVKARKGAVYTSAEDTRNVESEEKTQTKNESSINKGKLSEKPDILNVNVNITNKPVTIQLNKTVSNSTTMNKTVSNSTTMNKTEIHKPTKVSYNELAEAELKSSPETAVNQLPSPNRGTKVYASANSHPGMVMPVVITILLVPMFAVLGYMALRRGQEAWKNRHYKRMDFLLDGMYND